MLEAPYPYKFTDVCPCGCKGERGANKSKNTRVVFFVTVPASLIGAIQQAINRLCTILCVVYRNPEVSE